MNVSHCCAIVDKLTRGLVFLHHQPHQWQHEAFTLTHLGLLCAGKNAHSCWALTCGSSQILTCSPDGIKGPVWSHFRRGSSAQWREERLFLKLDCWRGKLFVLLWLMETDENKPFVNSWHFGRGGTGIDAEVQFDVEWTVSMEESSIQWQMTG